MKAWIGDDEILEKLLSPGSLRSASGVLCTVGEWERLISLRHMNQWIALDNERHLNDMGNKLNGFLLTVL